MRVFIKYKKFIFNNMNKLETVLNNDIEKLNDIVEFYKKVLYSIDLNKKNIIDHIRNIRHYTELLEDKIDDLNQYAIIEKIPACREQIDRDKLVNENKKVFNQFMIYSILNQ